MPRRPSRAPRWAWPYGGFLASTDPVAVDAVARQVLEDRRKEVGLKSLAADGREPAHIAAAATLGLGTADLARIERVEVCGRACPGAGGRRAFLGRIAASCAGCALAAPHPFEGGPAGALEAAPLQDPSAARATQAGKEAGLDPTPARWWKPLADGWVECGVSPRSCRISEDERGTCGTRENRRGTLYTLVHSRPCAVAVDPVEKKPFFHVLPGSTALSLGTAGCNLECRCCQNWEIAQARPEQVPSVTS